MNQGTPKTLREAIKREIQTGPLNTFEKRMYFATKDFLAQEFGISYMKANQETLAILSDLYKRITREEYEEKS